MFTILKLKAIKKAVKKNGGATLTPALKNANYKRGYMVSITGYEKQLKIENLTIKTLKLYRKEAKRLNACVGFWIDNNILYIDISKHFQSKEKACQFSIKNNQLALYDIYNNKSIYTKDFVYKTVKKSVLTF